MHVHVIVTKDVAEVCQAKWLTMAEELVRETRKENGCIFYSFVQNSSNPTRFVIVEEWESRQHLENHFQTEHFKSLVPQMDAISHTAFLDICTDDAVALPTHNGNRGTAAATTVVVTKDVDVAMQPKWLAMAEELVRETRKEDGCNFYSFLKSPDNPTRFVIVEDWTSRAHLEAHFKTAHFQRLVPAMDAISSTPNLDVCNALPPIPTTPRSRHRRGRILVLYDSSTYCTESMAVLVAEGARQSQMCDVRLRAIPGAPNHWDKTPDKRTSKCEHIEATFSDLFWADGIACGTPTNLGSLSWRMKKFWDDFSQVGYFGCMDGKLGCSFSSEGGLGGGAELVCMAMNAVLLNFGISIIGVTDYVGFKNTGHYGATVAKAPRDEMDKIVCRRQGLRLAELVGYHILHHEECHPLLATKAVDNLHWGIPGIPVKNSTVEDCLVHEKRVFDKAAEVARECSILRTTPEGGGRVLIFTKMDAYCHGSTAAAASWLQTTCHSLGLHPTVSDDSALLEQGCDVVYDLIIFINNSGELFDVSKERLVQEHIAAGRGVLGVHAAIASFLDDEDASGAKLMGSTTSIIEDVFRCHFKNHPPIQTGTVHVDKNAQTNLPGLNLPMPSDATSFEHTDEFFNFSRNPCDDKDVTVIASVDESTYEGGLMGKSHPVVWYHTMGPKKAPIFYCALGHSSHFYNGQGPGHVAEFLTAGIKHCLK